MFEHIGSFPNHDDLNKKYPGLNKLKIWLNEYADSTNSPQARDGPSIKLMSESLSRLDRDPRIERYSYFGATRFTPMQTKHWEFLGGWPALLTDGAGAGGTGGGAHLKPFGELYVNKG